jgi:hypothetical protein
MAVGKTTGEIIIKTGKKVLKEYLGEDHELVRYIDSTERAGAESKQSVANTIKRAHSRKTGSQAAIEREKLREQDPRTIIEVDRPIERQIKDVEKFHRENKGQPMVALPADTSDRGTVIKQVAGVPLKRRITTEGGDLYGHEKEAWQSNISAAQGKQGHYEKVAKKTKQDVIAVYMGMGLDGSNFATMSSEVMIDLLESAAKKFDIPESILEEFDLAMKAAKYPKKKGQKQRGYIYPDWNGVSKKYGKGETQEDRFDNAFNQLIENGRGDARKTFMKIAGSAKYREQGFPDFMDIYEAITNPRHLYSPHGSTGALIARPKLGTGAVFEDPSDHRSYTHKMLFDEILGSFEDDIPFDIFFRDIVDQMRKEGAEDSRIYRKIQTTGQPRFHQKVNDRWLDLTSTYLEVLNRLKNVAPEMTKTQMQEVAKHLAEIKILGGKPNTEFLKKVGYTGTSLTAIMGLSALPETNLQASVFQSSIKTALKSLPKKTTPEEYIKLLKKQKGVSQNMVDKLDTSVLGDDVVTRADIEKLVDEQLPKIVIAEKRVGELPEGWDRGAVARELLDFSKEYSINEHSRKIKSKNCC